MTHEALDQRQGDGHGQRGIRRRRILGDDQDHRLRTSDRGRVPHPVLSALLDPLGLDEGHAADRRLPVRQQDGLRIFLRLLPVGHHPVGWIGHRRPGHLRRVRRRQQAAVGRHTGAGRRRRLPPSGLRARFHQARGRSARRTGPGPVRRAAHQRSTGPADGRRGLPGGRRTAGTAALAPQMRQWPGGPGRCLRQEQVR